MKVSEHPQGGRVAVATLTGAQLAYWTAKAQEWEKRKGELKDGGYCGYYCWFLDDTIKHLVYGYRPDLNWAQCGPLIEEFKVNVIWNESLKEWIATIRNIEPAQHGDGVGENPAIAICRAVVSSAFGDEVSLSDDNVASVYGEEVDES